MSRTVFLGELLELGASSSAQLHTWLELEDESLAELLQREAAARGESLAQFVRIAVSDFLADADEDSWASLVSTLREARDPSAACLAVVAGFRVRSEASA